MEVESNHNTLKGNAFDRGFAIYGLKQTNAT